MDDLKKSRRKTVLFWIVGVSMPYICSFAVLGLCRISFLWLESGWEQEAEVVCPDPPNEVNFEINFSLASENLEIITTNNLNQLQRIATIDPNGNLARRKVAFSHDSQYIAVAGDYVTNAPGHPCGDVWVWQLASDKVQVLRATTGTNLHFIPNTNLIFIGDLENMRVHAAVWNFQTGELIEQFYDGKVIELPDGYYVAYIEYYGDPSQDLWSPIVQTTITEDDLHVQQVRLFLPDSEVFLVSGRDMVVHVMDTRNFLEIIELQTCRVEEFRENERSPYIQVSIDKSWLVIACWYGYEMWNLETFELYSVSEDAEWVRWAKTDKVFSDHQTRFKHWTISDYWNNSKKVEFSEASPDETFLIAKSEEGLEFIEIPTGEILPINLDTTGTTDIDFSPDGTLIAAIVDGHVELWGIPIQD